MSIQHHVMKGNTMEKEFSMKEKDERCDWIPPSVTDWDIESETNSCCNNGTTDGSVYS